ncbi:MAG: Tetratricopeptide 2 repeat protein [Nocardioides sp.]|nr:Tetratricopeptide 2 repeat protein [Nocardioides sp.]
MLSFSELHGRGVAAINSGRLPDARRLLERGLAAAVDDDQRALAEASLAYVLAETGDPTEALLLCDRALGRAHLSERTTGVLHSQRALLLMRRGASEAALGSFAVAIDMLDDDLHLGRAFLNRGGVYLQQGRSASAVDDFRLAEEHLVRAGRRADAAKAAHNLGYAALLTGDLVLALRSMEGAYPVISEQGVVMRAICEQDRAEVLMAAGLVTEGRTALREAARAYGLRRLTQRQAEAELALARSLTVAEPGAALEAARRAGRRFRTVGATAWAARADAVVLASEVELGRRGPSLVVRADRVAAALDGQGVDAGAMLIRLHAARVLVRRGDLPGASDRLRSVRPSSRSPLGVRMLARTARVELAEAQGRPRTALDQVRAGLDDLHAWQSTFGSLDLQTSVVGQARRLAGHGLRIAADAGRPELLFEWSERARMLTSRVLPVRPPSDPEQAEALGELRRLNSSSGGVRTPAQRRDTELRRRVRERAWQRAGSGEVADPCDLAELRAALGAGTALVAHVVAAGRVVAVVVTDAGVSCHELGPRARLADLLRGLMPDLDVAATDLPDPIAGAVRAELAARLRDLDHVLVAPFLAELGDRAVVLTPSGLLAGMPWPLLAGLRGRPVTVAQSATTWLARRTTPLRVASAGFVAGPRVARAEQEVRAAARARPDAYLLTGAGATAAAVSELATRVDVLHLAAHGRHSSENPMFSGLELVDGPWFGYDIDQLPTVPDVVLLSACELGRSSVRWGEELIGMTTAWLHAGTRCVVAATAAVSDDVACDVLVRVHSALGEGATPAAGLAAAVSEVGPDAPPTPFVCFGNS